MEEIIKMKNRVMEYLLNNIEEPGHNRAYVFLLIFRKKWGWKDEIRLPNREIAIDKFLLHGSKRKWEEQIMKSLIAMQYKVLEYPSVSVSANYLLSKCPQCFSLMYIPAPKNLVKATKKYAKTLFNILLQDNWDKSYSAYGLLKHDPFSAVQKISSEEPVLVIDIDLQEEWEEAIEKIARIELSPFWYANNVIVTPSGGLHVLIKDKTLLETMFKNRNKITSNIMEVSEVSEILFKTNIFTHIPGVNPNVKDITVKIKEILKEIKKREKMEERE